MRLNYVLKVMFVMHTSLAQHKCPDSYVCGYSATPEHSLANKCPAGYCQRVPRTLRESIPMSAVFLLSSRHWTSSESMSQRDFFDCVRAELDDCSADLFVLACDACGFDLIEKSYAKAVNGSSLNEALRPSKKH